MKRLLPLLLLSCAPLDAVTLKESCATAYNACLNRCPSAETTRRAKEPRVRTEPLRMPPAMIDVAACTQRCNDEAQACEHPPPVAH